MNDERASLRRIFISTSIVGGATAVSIAIGLVRNKLLALLIGPAGIGLIGVFTSIMATAAATGGMGLNFSGVRQVAADQSTRREARRAVWLATWPLALVAALAIWIGRFAIARFVMGSDQYAFEIGLTAVGVFLTIIAASQVAVVAGYQLLGNLARMRILGALLSLVIAIPAVLYLGPVGIVVAVIAVPLGSVLAALPYLPKRDAGDKGSRVGLIAQWRQLFGTGAVVMLTTTLATLTLVLVRTIIVRQGGLAEAGLYQAAYSISAVNVSLVLAAMGADYFPRIAAIEKDRAASNQLVNHQLRTIMLMGTPILVATVAVAPLITQILYSSAFRPAAGMLSWQVTGELLKFPAWTLGFLLLARQDNVRYFLTESLFVALYVAGSFILFPLIGLTGVGLAYLGAYCLDTLVLLGLCRARHGLILSGTNLWFLAGSLGTLVGLAALAQVLPTAGTIGGLALAAGFALYAAREFGLIGHGRATA